MNVRSTALAFLLGLTLASSVQNASAAPDDPAKEASPADREKSRAAFRKGVQQLKAQDWTGARASFEEAWSLVQHPSILLNLGISRLKTDDPVLAEQDLTRFMSEDSAATGEELASARDALAEARSKIGMLRVVSVPRTSKVSVDGKSVPVKTPEGGDSVNADVKLKVGKHTLLVEAEGYTADKRDVEVASKADTDVSVALVAGGDRGGSAIPGSTEGSAAATHSGQNGWMDPKTRKIVGWSLAGVGGVALIGTVIMGARAVSLSSAYNDPKNTLYQDPATRDQGAGLATGATVTFILAVLCGAGAVVLLATDIGKGTADDTMRSRWHRTQPLLMRW